ncbi:hypothetical protein TorRG33x02_053600 [Trema orientale]|uniref:Uncharacterized protein n=1 Tax=Trema orientale TaxID=63057 RepID=A0A2P5FLR8_TREOI|nr:hypothetical protein TorRG33x02_053600 [Trema orientale]
MGQVRVKRVDPNPTHFFIRVRLVDPNPTRTPFSSTLTRKKFLRSPSLSSISMAYAPISSVSLASIFALNRARNGIIFAGFDSETRSLVGRLFTPTSGFVFPEWRTEMAANMALKTDAMFGGGNDEEE